MENKPTIFDKKAMDKLAYQVIKNNLIIIFLLVVINIVLVYILQSSSSLVAIGSNIIGVAIGNLFSERSAIINFYFGSSLTRKQKNEKEP